MAAIKSSISDLIHLINETSFFQTIGMAKRISPLSGRTNTISPKIRAAYKKYCEFCLIENFRT